ncbi:MAG TPA: MotA/TolQ/ExbB proton channel family protein [Opitutus sp.]|nr:MotA/TolQ/ExbB proton channel family protein [Opitutus sp.]
MTQIIEFVERGGPVMIAIIALSVALYSRCCKLLLTLRRQRRRLAATTTAGDPDGLRQAQADARQAFQQQRVALGAMIAAAPLLGLLGTVSGMVKTFESLSARGGEKSMEGLARGISEVLVATESGLAVAIPALLLVYLAHREMHRHVQALNRRETQGRKELAA